MIRIPSTHWQTADRPAHRTRASRRHSERAEIVDPKRNVLDARHGEARLYFCFSAITRNSFAAIRSLSRPREILHIQTGLGRLQERQALWREPMSRMQIAKRGTQLRDVLGAEDGANIEIARHQARTV